MDGLKISTWLLKSDWIVFRKCFKQVKEETFEVMQSSTGLVSRVMLNLLDIQV